MSSALSVQPKTFLTTSEVVVAVQLLPDFCQFIYLPLHPHEYRQNVLIRTPTRMLRRAQRARSDQQRSLQVQLQARGRSLQVATESDADVGKRR